MPVREVSDPLSIEVIAVEVSDVYITVIQYMSSSPLQLVIPEVAFIDRATSQFLDSYTL